jgi:alpha-galactosidase
MIRKPLAALTAGVLCVLGAAAVVTGSQLATAPAADALDNGLALTPPMGFNDWNAFGCNVSAQLIEQTADAMVTDGMKAAGYQYVNIDDCWALPERDADGNLVPDPAKFPDGVKAVADYVHADGLKLGLYNDSGSHTCSKSHGFPGSLGYEYQDALQFATWGIDYLKDDDCNQPADQQNVAATVQRYQTQRDALAKAAEVTGHRIVFSICEKTDFGVPNSAWPRVGNLWRTTGDIHDTFASMVSNFHKNVELSDLAGPGAWNDPDMLEIGNGGQTDSEYRSEFSLWAEMAAPLIAGTPIAAAGGKPAASPDTLAIYENKDVIAVDQDPLGKQGTVVSNDGGHWVLTKPLADGDVAVALFNETDTPAVIGSTAVAAGLRADTTGYAMRDLWTHETTETAGTIGAAVAPHATVMYRVTPIHNPTTAPPNVTLEVSGLSALTAGQPGTATETFTDNGVLPAQRVQLSLHAPEGWTVDAQSPTTFGAVESGRTVQATFRVVAPVPDQLFQYDGLVGTAAYRWHGQNRASTSVTQTATTSPPVHAPYRTYSSATDARAHFGQSGQDFGISGAGAGVSSSSDGYSAIYLPRSVHNSSTIDTTVATQQGLTGSGSAGILVRNDMTGSGSEAEGVALSASPSGGVQLRWASGGGTHLDSVAPADKTDPWVLPVHLRLERKSSTSYTGYYSYTGTGWLPVGTATVTGQADIQDAGLFESSSVSGSPATVSFGSFTVGDGAAPPPAASSFEAEASTNALGGQARVASCSGCSGGRKAGSIGKSGTLTFTGVEAPADGDYLMSILYLNGPPSRQAQVSVDGGAPQTLSFAVTTDFNTLGVKHVAVHLVAGANTVEFSNPSDNAPDIDRIIVSPEAAS